MENIRKSDARLQIKNGKLTNCLKAEKKEKAKSTSQYAKENSRYSDKFCLDTWKLKGVGLELNQEAMGTIPKYHEGQQEESQ